jgi:MarR family transcriptional regulator, organic hydroperoxide resistance regulator
MAASERSKAGKRERAEPVSAQSFVYPPKESVGHQVRWAHRALQRELEERLRPYGITTGMWYFLRALWEEDGLSQRELSDRVGTTEPTTVSALHSMEKRGLAIRVPNMTDRRKSNIFLTRPAKELHDLLLREARNVNRTATAGIDAAEIRGLKSTLEKIRKNLAAANAERQGTVKRNGKPGER